MTKGRTRQARLAAAAIALTAWTGLAVQFGASLGQTGSAGAALWEMLRFFTIIGNLLAAIAFTAIAAGSRRAGTPFVLGGVTLTILLIGVVHFLLLRGLLHLSGGAKLADVLLHQVTPLLVLLYWLGFAPKAGLRRRDAMIWALLPLAYFAYALARAAADGKYPYPFMNAAQLGWPRVVANAALIALGFMLAALALVAIARRLARRSS